MQSWPMKVYSSKFILPETKKVQIFAVFAWICFKVLFFFQKWQLTIESIEPLFGEICVFVFFFAGHFKDIQNWFHCFCPLFQSAFPFSWHCSLCLFTVFLAFPFDFGAVSPEIQQPDPPAGCVARREKNK